MPSIPDDVIITRQLTDAVVACKESLTSKRIKPRIRRNMEDNDSSWLSENA